jgi:hypothetical protein
VLVTARPFARMIDKLLVRIVPEPSWRLITPFNTKYGQCGTSYFDITSKTSYKTGYTIYTSFGYTVSWSWQATLQSSIDMMGRSFGGPFATQSWGVRVSHQVQALHGTYLNGQAGGSVLTTGGICFTLIPSDRVLW